MTLIPTAEPFFLPGGPTGCLLVHGFTGTPKEMRWLGEYLAGRGHTVLGIRLAGHATCPEDLLRTRWQDWLHSVEEGWHLLKDSTQAVFVMGLSMGGSLALLLASGRFTPSTPVAGVVAMSTPYALPDDPRLPYARLLAKIKPEVPKGPPDWRNLEAAQDHIDYPNYPTRGIVEMNNLLAEMRASLSEIRVPALLVHSKVDGSVPPVNMHRIFEHLGAVDKQMLWVENCGHVIVREPEREKIFQAIEDFILRISNPSTEAPR